MAVLTSALPLLPARKIPSPTMRGVRIKSGMINVMSLGKLSSSDPNSEGSNSKRSHVGIISYTAILEALSNQAK